MRQDWDAMPDDWAADEVSAIDLGVCAHSFLGLEFRAVRNPETVAKRLAFHWSPAARRQRRAVCVVL